MSVNGSITVAQAASVFNSLAAQATGNEALANYAADDFVSVAQTALKTGYSPILNALAQSVGKIIFSVRPYSAQFQGLKRDATVWGNITRKYSIADKKISEDSGYLYPVGYDATQTDNPTGDGKSVDMYTINKPDVLLTNFYSVATWQDSVTQFDTQLNVAFRSPDEFAQFLSMVMGNMSDKHEQYSERVSAALISNLVGALIDEGNASRVIHLLTDYNTYTGGAYTATTIHAPDVYQHYKEYCLGRLKGISRLMESRSSQYQTQITGYTVNKHTPKADQRLYLLAQEVYDNETMALANTYNPEMLGYGDYEEVPYWQSIATPDSVQVTPVYTGADGTAKTGAEVTQANIFGVLCDRDSLGYAEFDSTMYPTPFNARGRYTTFWAHSLYKCWFDCTEKAVVFLND